MRADGLVKRHPRLLRAGVQPVVAGEQHHCLQIATDIGPLRDAERRLRRDKEPDRRAEELVVAGILPVAAGLVGARDADRLIQHLADLERAGAIGFDHRIGIDAIVAALAFRQFVRARGQMIGKRRELRAGERIDAPRLQIAGRRRTRRAFDDLADDLFGNGFGKEGPAGVAGSYGVAHVHLNNTLRGIRAIMRGGERYASAYWFSALRLSRAQ